MTVVIFTSCAHPKHAMTLSFSLQNGTETTNRSIKLATVAVHLDSGVYDADFVRLR